MSLLSYAQSFANLPAYADRIPADVRTNITRLGYYIESANFDPTVLAPFINGMLVKIARQEVEKYTFEGSDFGRFYKGNVPVGGYIETDYISPMDAEGYPLKLNEGDWVNPYIVHKPKVKTTYFAMNWGLQYWTTITEEQLSTAFTSEEALGDFVEKAVGVLVDSLHLDRYLIIREMFGAGDIYGQTKAITVAATSTASLTEAEALEIVQTIRLTAEGIKKSNTQYNKADVLNNIRDDDLVLVISSGMLAIIETAMKKIYHNELDLGVKPENILKVDGFGTTGATAGMFAALVSERGVKLYDKTSERTAVAYNERGDYWNHFLRSAGWIGYGDTSPAVKFTIANNA